MDRLTDAVLSKELLGLQVSQHRSAWSHTLLWAPLSTELSPFPYTTRSTRLYHLLSVERNPLQWVQFCNHRTWKRSIAMRVSLAVSSWQKRSSSRPFRTVRKKASYMYNYVYMYMYMPNTRAFPFPIKCCCNFTFNWKTDKGITEY